MNVEPDTWVHPFERARLGRAPFRFAGMHESVYSAAPGHSQPGGTCEFCGMGIRYVCTVEGADGKRFSVGTDCVARVGETAEIVAEIKAWRRERAAEIRAQVRAERDLAREAAERIVRDARRAAFESEHPDVIEALKAEHPLLVQLAAALDRWGNLSPGRCALALKIAAEVARRASLPPEVLVPAPEGRVVVEGEVVSLKARESEYGIQLKLTIKVRDAEGRTWLAWGTCPQSLLDRKVKLKIDDLRCYRVRLTATLKSGREAHFALMSRPTKAEILGRGEMGGIS